MKFLTLIFFYIVYQTAFAQQNINSITTKDIKVNGNLEVNSTTKASKPCPAMSESQRDAMTMDETGAARCIYNTNTNQLNIYNGTIWKSAGGGISNWETAFNYALNDVVIYSAKIYQANTAHTSTSFASDIANWTILSNDLPIDLASEVSGILPMANGGTDKALTPTLGGVVYTDANSMEVLGAGTSGQVLKSNGAAAPTWQDSSNKLQGEKQSEVSFTKLKARNRSVTQTGTGEYLLEDQENLLYNGNSESATLLDGWTCTNSGGFSAETTEPLDGNKSLKVQPLTVGGYTCYQDFNINQNQRGQSLLLSAMVRASGSDTLQICYRENGVVTSICSQAVTNGIPATEAIIGSSATSIGYQFTIPYNSLGLVVRMDKFDMRYGTAVTNQPALGQMIDYGPLNITATTTNPTKGTARSVDKLKCAQIGPNLRCIAKYFQSNAGTAGSGRYDVNLPAGVRFSSSVETYNLTVLSGAYGNGDIYRAAIGHCSFSVSGGIYRGTAIATSATTFACAQYHLASTVYVLWSSTYNHLGAAAYIDFDITAELDGGNSSVPTYTGRCNDKKNCSTTLAFSRNTSNVISNISPASSTFNPTCSGTTTLICDLTSGNFTVTPVCWARRLDAQEVAQYASATSTTSVTFPLINLAGSSVNIPVRVYCERQGSDLENASILQQNVALKNYSKTEISSGSGTDSFSFSYGATATTVCASGTCAYLDQIGNYVSSVVWTATGTYTINFNKTYTKLKCMTSLQIISEALSRNRVRCENCNSVQMITINSSNEAVNTFGTLYCQGQY